MKIGELVIIKNKYAFVKGYVKDIFINSYGEKEVNIYTVDGTDKDFIGYVQGIPLTDEIVIEKEKEVDLIMKKLEEKNLMYLINLALDKKDEAEFIYLTEKLKNKGID